MIVRTLLAAVAALAFSAGAALAQPSGGGGGGGSSGPVVQPPNSSANYTVQASDCGSTIPFTAPGLATVTLPGSLTPGCTVTEQEAGGQLFNQGGPGATLAGSYNAPSASGSSLQLVVSTNTTGSTAQWGVLNTGAYYSPSGTIEPNLPPPQATPTFQYYANASTGVDTNTGLSPAQAWLTTTAINNFAQFQPNTQINLSGAFTGCLAFVSGGNVSTATSLTAGIALNIPAGSSITSNCPGTASGNQGPKSSVVKFDGVNGVFVTGGGSIHCNNNGTQWGVMIQDSVNGNGIAGVTLNGPSADGCNISTSATQDYASEFEILGYTTTAACVPVDKILIENVSASGTAITSTDDDGINVRGCTNGAAVNMTNVTFSGNFVTNIGGRASGVYGGGSGNGILCNGCQYLNDEYNVVTNGGANTTSCGGPGANWVYNTDSADIHNNISSGMGPTGGVQPAGGCDWLAVDLDGGTTRSVVRYNYSYNNGGPGVELYMDGGGRGVWGNNRVYGNISVDDNALDVTTNSHSLGENLGLFAFAGTGNGLSGPAYVYNNTFYNSQTAYTGSCVGFYAAPLGGVWANNICWLSLATPGNTVMIDGGGQNVPSNFYYLSNDYFNLNSVSNFKNNSFGGQLGCYSLVACGNLVPGGEAGSLLFNPGFQGTPPDATCAMTAGVGPQPCPVNSPLNAYSHLRGIGTNLTAPPYNLPSPVTDYFGVQVPMPAGSSTGTGWNIGAAGN